MGNGTQTNLDEEVRTTLIEQQKKLEQYKKHLSDYSDSINQIHKGESILSTTTYEKCRDYFMCVNQMMGNIERLSSNMFVKLQTNCEEGKKWRARILDGQKTSQKLHNDTQEIFAEITKWATSTLTTKK
jgi:hypothetical protein